MGLTSHRGSEHVCVCVCVCERERERERERETPVTSQQKGHETQQGKARPAWHLIPCEERENEKRLGETG